MSSQTRPGLLSWVGFENNLLCNIYAKYEKYAEYVYLNYVIFVVYMQNIQNMQICTVYANMQICRICRICVEYAKYEHPLCRMNLPLSIWTSPLHVQNMQ